MKTIWLTDLHLHPTTGKGDPESLFVQLREEAPDVIMISGDISVSDYIFEYLVNFNDLGCTILFTLGNHEYYQDGIVQSNWKQKMDHPISIHEFNERIKDFIKRYKNLHWLDYMEPYFITQSTAIIGHTGWADGLYGDIHNSHTDLVDYHCIRELITAGKPIQPIEMQPRLDAMEELAQTAADHIRRNIIKAFHGGANEIILLTHVPPWKQLHLFGGEMSNESWMPYFTSKIMGRTITETMALFPDERLISLSGHTHHYAEFNPAENISAINGEFKHYPEDKINLIITR